jgi:CBS domain-containing protein
MKPWKVQDVMSKNVVSVRLDTPYAEIVNTLAKHKISAVPVLDHFSRVVGVVSQADLLHKVEFLGQDTEAQFFEWGTKKVNRSKANAGSAEELMTSPAITIQPGMSVIAAARRLEDKHVKRMPVVDAFGLLLGIVSRSDLLKMYLRPDFELRHEVVEDVLRRMLWIDPLTVEVDVVDGVVILNGHVDRRSIAEIAVNVTKSVPGVIRVVDQIRWIRDDVAVPAESMS